MTELTTILDKLKQIHGTDAGTAAAAGVTGATISRLRNGTRPLVGIAVLCGLLRATGSAELQTRLLQVSGISDALRQGQDVVVKRRV